MQQYKQNNIPDGQNKYVYLMEKLHPYMTPYIEAEEIHNTLVTKEINANINVIVNNLDEFYSHVFGIKTSQAIPQVIAGRFVIEHNTLGLTQLYASQKQDNFKRIPLTPNDNITIKSLLTFPKAFVLYSHINLPNTSLLKKAQLNQINLSYWAFLHKNTTILSQFPDNKDMFLQNIIEFTEDSEAIPSEDKYKIFLQKFVPNTSELFKYIQKNIKNKVSFLKVIEYLEPFMVYDNDINVKQYTEIKTFIQQQIVYLKQHLIKQKKEN